MAYQLEPTGKSQILLDSCTEQSIFLLKIQNKTQKPGHIRLRYWYTSAPLDTLYVQLEIHNHLKPGHLHILHGYHCFQLESKF